MKRGIFPRVGLIAAVVLASLQGACAQTYEPTILEYLQKEGHFQTFLRLAQSTGIDHWFTGNSATGCTVLAPTDMAFARLPQSVLTAFDKNRDLLRKVIGYHVVLRERSAAELKLGPATLEGEGLSLTEGVPSRTANIYPKDVEADNGKVQVIDQVLIPPSVLTSLQRDGVIDIAFWFGPDRKMTGAGIIHDVSTRSNSTKANKTSKKRTKGHWGRVPGSYGRVWIPASG